MDSVYDLEPAAAPQESTPRRAPDRRSEAEEGASDSPDWRDRHFAVAGELGWNSLAGGGALVAWRPLAHLALDMGVGYSFRGLRLGGRVRVPLLAQRVAPYVGMGLSYDLGVSGDITETHYSYAFSPTSSVADATSYSSTAETTTTHYSGVFAGYNLQLVGGVSWVSPGGFYLISSGGYSFRLPREENASWSAINGVIDWFTGSGPVLSLGLGYAF